MMTISYDDFLSAVIDVSNFESSKRRNFFKLFNNINTDTGEFKIKEFMHVYQLYKDKV